MSLTPNSKIESKDIKLQSIGQYSVITHDQLDTNYYYFDSPHSQSQGTKIYPPSLRSYAITMATNNSAYGTTSIDTAAYTVSSSSQTRSISYSAASGYKFDYWSVSGGSASVSGSILTIGASAYGNITVTGYFELVVPTSLSIGGSWSKTQYTGQAVNYTGLSFTCTYSDGSTATVTPSNYSPITWSSTAGTQTCTFYYTENGVTVSATKDANVELKIRLNKFGVDETATSLSFT